MKIRGVKMYESFTGLCNQLISLLVRIQRAKKYGIELLLIDDFMLGLDCKETCPIEHILCLDSLNEMAKPVVVAGKNAVMTIDKIEYGSHDPKMINITPHFIKEGERSRRKFHIGTSVNLNLLGGDPSPGQKKHLRVTYCIDNHYRLVERQDEDSTSLTSPIDIDLDALHYSFQFGWMNSDNSREDFDQLLSMLRFRPAFYREYPMKIHGNISPIGKTHVIHLRVEPDAIQHWSKKNNMTAHDFSSILYAKYIDIITSRLLNTRAEGDRLLILSYSESNPVIAFLKDHQYPHAFIEKDHARGREWNAIVDLVTAFRKCNGLFIGNFNLGEMRGSTFSYMLYTLIRQQEQSMGSVLIDLDDIRKDASYEQWMPSKKIVK